MIKKTLALSLATLSLTAQGQTNKKLHMMQKSAQIATSLPQNLKTNPLLVKSSLLYQAPELDKIKDIHFAPAFDFGMQEQLQEIASIIQSKEKPSFENTILALEISGQNLNRAQTVFGNLNSANTNATLQELDKKYAPIFAAHTDAIYLNSDLYKKIKQLDEIKNQLDLDAESLRLIEIYKQRFEIAGANLTEEKKAQLKKINQELATLSSEFAHKLLEATNKGALFISQAKELEGLSKDEKENAQRNAQNAGYKNGYLLVLQNTTQQPLLQNLKNRATREKLYKASWERAQKNDANDTRATLEKIAKLRLEKAHLLGKESFAHWALQNQMAKTPEAAFDLLAKLAKPAVLKAKEEAKDIQALIKSENENFTLEPWDWNFYAEQVRKQKFDLDENELKPYFEIQTVLEKGVFFAAEKFYGLTFKKRTDLPVYHPDVVTYEVFDSNHKSIALYYLDFYARDNKRGGAWMNAFVKQSHYLKQKPVIVNVFNYQKPGQGKPSLVSYDDVTTMFHEFGHSLHGMFANQKFASLSGTSVPRDFVEFPSQINEHFALEPTVLKNYALHFKTKEPISEALVEKLKKSKTFNEGYAVTELLAAATIDLAWHSIKDSSEIKPTNEFENKALKKYGLLVNEVPTRYHSPYFLHVFSNGYASGYYAYLWSEMLDFNAYHWIETHGGMTRENGNRFREYILSVGNSMDLNKAFENFNEKAPSLEPLLKGRGLK